MVLRSIISEDIFFIPISLEATSSALITDGPKPTIVKSFPFFLIKDFVGSKKNGLFGAF